MKITKLIGGVAAATGVLVLSLTGAGTAHADTNVGQTLLAVVGSDTTQDVMEGESNAIRINGQPVMSNYLASSGAAQITTRTGNAACTFNRPASSGQGRDALSAAMRNVTLPGGGAGTTTDCVQVARSSSTGNPTTSPGVGSMTYIPFAADAVTYATLQNSPISHTLTFANLVTVYSLPSTSPACYLNGGPFQPLLPQASSGTRQFFLAQLGGATPLVPGSCVSDTLNGLPIQENNGNLLTNAKQIIPHSVASWIGQASSIATDARGNSTLGSVDFGQGQINPWAITNFKSTVAGGSSLQRLVYNVVPTTETTNGSVTQQVFVGSGSLMCTGVGLVTIQAYGFAPISNCGDTTTKNTN